MNTFHLTLEQTHLVIGGMLLFIIVHVIATIVVNKRNKAALKDANDQVNNLKEGMVNKQEALNRADIKISTLTTEIKQLHFVINADSKEIASLTGQNALLKAENKKLLEAASDDVTINVVAEEASIPVVNPTPRRRYKKKKNAGSIASNPKVGKGK